MRKMKREYNFKVSAPRRLIIVFKESLKGEEAHDFWDILYTFSGLTRVTVRRAKKM